MFVEPTDGDPILMAMGGEPEDMLGTKYNKEYVA